MWFIDSWQLCYQGGSTFSDLGCWGHCFLKAVRIVLFNFHHPSSLKVQTLWTFVAFLHLFLWLSNGFTFRCPQRGLQWDVWCCSFCPRSCERKTNFSFWRFQKAAKKFDSNQLCLTPSHEIWWELIILIFTDEKVRINASQKFAWKFLLSFRSEFELSLTTLNWWVTRTVWGGISWPFPSFMINSKERRNLWCDLQIFSNVIGFFFCFLRRITFLEFSCHFPANFWPYAHWTRRVMQRTKMEPGPILLLVASCVACCLQCEQSCCYNRIFAS